MSRLARQQAIGYCRQCEEGTDQEQGAVMTHVQRWMRSIANVFVIMATNKLINQKLSTTKHMMKKKQEMKYSDWMTVYINVDHYHTQTGTSATTALDEDLLMCWQTQ